MKKKLTRTDKVFIILGVIFSILLICSGVFYNEIYTKINTGADILLWSSLIAVIVLFIAAFFRILYLQRIYYRAGGRYPNQRPAGIYADAACL